jgi:TolA-binding protein
MKKHLMAVTAFGLLGGLILAGTTWSQAPATVAKPVAAPPASNPNFSRYEVSPGAGISGYRVVQSEIGQLMHQLREADDDAKKADLTKKLETAVDKQFDEDLKNRETELTKLEERLTKLRAQLDRRRKAKAEIIQLQIKVLVNEADGLGFSGASFADPNSAPGVTLYGVGAGGGSGFSAPGGGFAPGLSRTPITPAGN